MVSENMKKNDGKNVAASLQICIYWVDNIDFRNLIYFSLEIFFFKLKNKV